MNDLIKKLVEAYGPSGFEDHIRGLVRAEIEAFADDITVDAMGNLIAHKQGDGSGLKVMIAAHLDEIGVMTTHITKEGFLRFTGIGGVRPSALVGNRVQFADGTVGIINTEPTDSWLKIYNLDRHFIDVGATSREDCPIGVGEAAGFKRAFVAQGNFLTAKSMDDRIGCVVAIEAMRRLKNSPHDIYFVFSVQEEVGTRGAQVAAQGLAPDVAIALDVTTTGDTPEAPSVNMRLGQGPAIKVKDSGMISHAGLVRLMRQRATEAGITHQMEVLVGGSTDARAMQVAAAGCAAGCISIPCRYVHTVSESVCADDVEGAVQLLLAILENPIAL